MVYQPNNKVGYARSTWRKAKEFSDALEELGRYIPPAMMRYYYMTGIRHPDYDENLYQKIDAAFAIRETAIQGEMKYAKVQAERKGIIIPREVLEGKSLQIAFPELEDQAPSLGVYQLFIPFTRAELQERKGD